VTKWLIFPNPVTNKPIIKSLVVKIIVYYSVCPTLLCVQYHVMLISPFLECFCTVPVLIEKIMVQSSLLG